MKISQKQEPTFIMEITEAERQWLEVANGTLIELQDIKNNLKATVSRWALRGCKTWLNETQCLGTDFSTQQFIYMASKSKTRESFESNMDSAIAALEAYIETLN